ncbi:hypothetical protein ElyMa_005572100 [Elysia marginata]|uniref:Uncharacterized protein n=1 Tax=Elysia marginata TaxID=1093978 RepID=A0AAV4F1Z2_9GAST|nr:hypothetical protein ElyMa_005572100 [Elysia marginata]
MSRKAVDDDEDELTDMEGLRHKALRHLNRRQRRVYEDSASSDDVLHTIRYKPRGPLSVAARRARLTSFNARINKQKRARAARRQSLGTVKLKWPLCISLHRCSVAAVAIATAWACGEQTSLSSSDS